jgi:SAM-dependent methyltransferase
MLPAVDHDDVAEVARQAAQRVAGGGGLDGLARLTAAIAAMETRRAEIIGGLRRGPAASWGEIGAACGMTRQGATRRWSRLVQASSFGAAAGQYQRGRPEYPLSAVEWLVPRRARRVLDLAAGTGKLTRSLAGAGLAVTAVEPSRGMRGQLEAAVPGAVVLAGTAENIPLAGASVDAVVVAHAWHWFDAALAVPEIARVLVPGGTLSLVWNMRDETEPWVAALGAIMHKHSRQAIDTSPEIGAPFGRPERMEVSWRQPVTRQEILDLVGSRSYVITMPGDERSELLAEVAELLGDHPALRGHDEIEMPYVTRCTRLRLAGLADGWAPGPGGNRGRANGGQDPVESEVPGLLQVAAEPERSREFHRYEAVSPGNDHARRGEGVCLACYFRDNAQERGRGAHGPFRPAEHRVRREHEGVRDRVGVGERAVRGRHGPQVGDGVAVARGRVECAGQLVGDVFEDEAEQVGAAADPLVQRRRAHSDRVGDVAHRQRVHAALFEQAPPGGHDGGGRGLRVRGHPTSPDRTRP